MAASGGGGQRGSGTVAFVAVTGLSLVLVLAVVNLVVFQYARGVVRAALDEGARAGSRLAVGAAECEARAQSVIADLAGGPISSDVVVTCQERGDLIVATASGTLPAVSPLVPSWSFVIAAEAVKERASP